MAATPNPVLVRFVRGDRVESEHRGRLVVVSRGGIERALGDVSEAVFWRSAAKPFQAAAAVEAGVAERYGLSTEELALCCASHNGEDEHADLARRVLGRAGFSEVDLACGPHPSIASKVAIALAQRGERPTKIRSNCSGKHALMLLFSAALGADPKRYVDPDHPVQVKIREAVSEIAELGSIEPRIAVDGCSAPTFALPLLNLAIGFRNLATAEEDEKEKAAGRRYPGRSVRFAPALARLRDAMLAHPFLVAGTGRFDTELMTACRGRVVSKIGAEGVVACGLPERGIGIAIKIDDGAARAYEALLIELLASVDVLDDRDLVTLAAFRGNSLRNFAGLETGRVEVSLPA